jgi:hypothetical protein
MLGRIHQNCQSHYHLDLDHHHIHHHMDYHSHGRLDNHYSHHQVQLLLAMQ